MSFFGRLRCFDYTHIRTLKSFSVNNAVPTSVAVLKKPQQSSDEVFKTSMPDLWDRMELISNSLEFEKFGLIFKSSSQAKSNSQEKALRFRFPKSFLLILLHNHNAKIRVQSFNTGTVETHKFSSLALEGRTLLNKNLANGLAKVYKFDMNNKTDAEILQDLEFKASIKIGASVKRIIRKYFPGRPCLAKLETNEQKMQLKDIKMLNKEAIFCIMGYLVRSQDPEKISELVSSKFTKPIIEEVIRDNF